MYFPMIGYQNWSKKVEETVETNNKPFDLPEMVTERCPCFDSEGHIDMDTNRNVLKAACRQGSEDNYLYFPSSQEINLKHFQHHWAKGEPVIVRNVLEATAGLSWEPGVMHRACRQIRNTKHETLLDVNAIDCLDCCEVSLPLNYFSYRHTFVFYQLQVKFIVALQMKDLLLCSITYMMTCNGCRDRLILLNSLPVTKRAVMIVRIGQVF